MPPPPTDAHSDAPPRAGLSLRTKLIVGGVLVIGAAVFVVANLKSWTYQVWANAADKEEYKQKILTTSDPLLDDRLLATAKDDTKATEVRRRCAAFLIERNHLRDVEDMLLKGSPRTQRVALAALAQKEWFHKTYLQDPAYPVTDVLVAWIGDTEAAGSDRAYAIQNLLSRVWPSPLRGADSTVPPKVLEALGRLLETRDESQDAAIGRVAAGLGVQRYHWCPGAPLLLDAARRETDPIAQKDLMQHVVTFFDMEGRPCAAELTEDAVRGVVEAALHRPGDDSLNGAARMAALSWLARHPAWAVKNVTEIRRILESGTRPEDRGSAIPALVATGDPSLKTDIARWLHDPSPNVRSQAATSLSYGKADLEPSKHLSLLVGYFFQDPAPGLIGFHDVALRLRSFAGSWVGFPEATAGSRQGTSDNMTPLFKDLVAGRPAEGKSRAEIGAAWWNWLAGKNDVGGDALKTAFAARDAFWAKAKAGDVAGARAALEGAPSKDSPLWEYERGWLAAKEKKP